MPRTVDSTLLSALQEDGVRMVHLVSLGIGSGLRYTDCAHDLTFNSLIYDASPYLLEVGNPRESRDLRVNQMNVQFSGVGLGIQGAFLQNDWMNKVATIYKAALASDGSIAGSPLLVFNGQISNWQFSESNNKSTVTVAISSHWSDFQKKQGRLTNNNSQQFYFSGDLGFEYAAHTVRDIKWGKK